MHTSIHILMYKYTQIFVEAGCDSGCDPSSGRRGGLFPSAALCRYVCICTLYAHIYICIHTHTHIYVYMHIYIHGYIHIYIYIYICIYTRIHIYVYIYTYIQIKDLGFRVRPIEREARRFISFSCRASSRACLGSGFQDIRICRA